MFNNIRTIVLVLTILTGTMWCVAEYYTPTPTVKEMVRVARTDLDGIADDMLKSIINK
jgi:hypothetical protein